MASVAVEITPQEELAAALAFGPPHAEIVYQQNVLDDVGAAAGSVATNACIDLNTKLEGKGQLENVDPATPLEFRLVTVNGVVLSTRQVPVANAVAISLTDAEVQLASARPAMPAAVPARVTRRAQLVPVNAVAIPFSKCRLQVASVNVVAQAWVDSGLAALFNQQAPVTTAVALAANASLPITSPTWQPVPLSVDGQFEADFAPGAGGAWLWWLTGAVSAIGVALDNLEPGARDARRRALPLPPLTLAREAGHDACGDCSGSQRRTLTANVSESDLATNPDLFSEDPGAFCRPFSNPSRIVGERNLQVIVRAEQPAIGPEGAVASAAATIPDLHVKLTATPDNVGVVARTIERVRRSFTSAANPRASDAKFVGKVPQNYVNALRRQARGRKKLEGENSPDWEGDATKYQATTVARGHILDLRVRWRSNGYSLGNVASTLTLAPRQTKRIQKIEWERSERVRRTEATRLTDQVEDDVERERTYEDEVRASLSEWARGQSRASTSAGAVGGGFVGSSFLVGGGAAHSTSTSASSQEGGRRTAASEEQRLHDSVRRYADSLRQLESTVVQEISQLETVTGTTETIRNPNYGHSITVIYHQILRHLRVDTELGGVRECLFVPLAMVPFTVVRAYRWREALRRGLRERRYAPAVQHLKDVLEDFENSDVPPGTRARQPIRHIYGSIFLKIAVERPRDTAEGGFDDAAWSSLRDLLGSPAASIFARLGQLAVAQRDRVFQAEEAPSIAAAWVNTLTMGTATATLPADFTLATRYRFNDQVRVDFSIPVDGQSVTREALASLRIRAHRRLPVGSVANVTRVTFTYRTDHFERTVAISQGANDLIDIETGQPEATGARLTAPLSEWEARNERAEITRTVEALIGHLNEHIEHYHKVIWWNMDRDRLYMLLDGFLAPGLNGVSVASVVERDPIAILGNCLVFRVAAGSFLGFGGITTPEELRLYYQDPLGVRDPLHISLPTDGLYAQTIMDECLALEEHFGTTDWVLNDPEPELGVISPELLTSRRAEPPPSATPTQFPGTIINLQNAPEAPAPSGVGGALQAVTTASAFRDMAGLAGTQESARAGLETVAAMATNFGNQAAALRQAETQAKQTATQTVDRKLASIERAAQKDLISSTDAQRQANKVLEELHTPSSSTSNTSMSTGDVARLASVAGAHQASVTVARPGGETVAINARNVSARQPVSEQVGFFAADGRVHTEATVIDEICDIAMTERDDNWLQGGAVVREGDNAAFPHLVRYWLTRYGVIPATTLATMGTNLAGVAFGDLTNAAANAGQVDAAIVQVRTALLVNNPGIANPADLASIVDVALREAHQSRLDVTAWSATLISAVVRRAAINLGLEAVLSGRTVGRDALLLADAAHSAYVVEAHHRRFAIPPQDGTYHAFRINEHPIRRGDIIVQDRQANQEADVRTFDQIPQLAAGREMHCDIVVEVSANYCIAIGGNVGESVRQRRYPLDTNGFIVSVLGQRYASQDDGGGLPNVPALDAAQGLVDASTRRIFSVLRLQQDTGVELGQPLQGGVVV